MSTTPSIPRQVGRTLGTAARGLVWAYRTIDWAEVAQIVIQCLKILVVLALLAGRGTRSLCDGLPAFSERIGKAYAALLVPPEIVQTVQTVQTVQVPITPPQRAPHLQALEFELEQLMATPHRQLMAMAGTRRKLSKRQLVAMLAAA